MQVRRQFMKQGSFYDVVTRKALNSCKAYLIRNRYTQKRNLILLQLFQSTGDS